MATRSLISLPLRGPLPRPLAAPAVRDAGLGVDLLTTSEAFADLAPAWNRLHSAASVASVFTSWIWQYQWWQVYGRRQALRLLVAYEGGEAIGILPLYVHEVRVLGVPVRLLRLVGSGGDTNPDDLGPVLEPRRAQAAAQALAGAALALDDADVLLVTDLSPECPFAPALEQAARARARAAVAAPSERIAFVRLPASWDEHLAALSKHRRTRVRYNRRRFAAAQGRFFLWQDAARLDAAFDRLAELHRLRWARAGGSESFASPEYLEFHRRVMRACLPRGWLRLYCLEIEGEVVAMLYGYRFRNAVYQMQGGFDPAHARLQPGHVLLGYALEHAIEEGNRAYDFLRGDHGYKDEVATDYRETRSVRVFRATPGALAYRLRRIWLPRLKARLLGRPPPKLRP